MRKILILLTLLLPLFVNAQNWFTADATSIATSEGASEWVECHIRVLADNDGNVKFFAPEDTFVYRRIGDDYTKDEDEEGMSMAWKCVDDEGQRCIISFNSYEGLLWLMIEYNNLTIFYHIIPDD